MKTAKQLEVAKRIIEALKGAGLTYEEVNDFFIEHYTPIIKDSEKYL